jgi:type I restriction enzyme S subunit
MANSSARLIEPGAVVFTRDATIGLAAITTKFMAVSQHIIAWVCLPGIYNQFLLNIIYAMKNELEKLTMGSTIKTIGMTDIKDLRMPIPPLEEQIKIVDKLNREKQIIEKAITKIEEQINELEKYRQALITAAVTGKIDVREEVERGAA